MRPVHSRFLLTSNPRFGSATKFRTSASPSSTLQTDSTIKQQRLRPSKQLFPSSTSLMHYANGSVSASTIASSPSSFSNSLHTINRLRIGAILGRALGSLIRVLIFLLLLLSLVHRRRKVARLEDTESKAGKNIPCLFRANLNAS
jgi:hypothetical protein